MPHEQRQEVPVGLFLRNLTMKFLFVLAAVAAVAYGAALSDSQIEEEWTSFKSTHSKSYDTEVEEEFRKKIFREHRNKIDTHNARYENGEVTFKVAVNKFADLLPHEFAAKMNGFNQSLASQRTKTNFHQLSSTSASSSVDWRDEGYVTAIKDQGQCGGCWAFSTTGSLEGALYKSTGSLVSLSEQQLIDCSTSNYGCDGGLMDYAFAYIKSNKGIDTESSYPYTGEDGSCSYSSKNSAGYDTSYVDVRASESHLLDAVSSIGPVSVAIDASNWSFQLYDSGIYYEESCSSSDLDHGVLVVGYGGSGTSKYWIVKNSWGTSWGLSGYIHMARDKKNNCGIATEASYPVV